jgi:hypothetical protein
MGMVGCKLFGSQKRRRRRTVLKHVFDALPVSTPFVPLYPTYRSVSRSFGLRSSYEIDTDQRPRNKSTAEPIFNYCFYRLFRLSTCGLEPERRGPQNNYFRPSNPQPHIIKSEFNNDSSTSLATTQCHSPNTGHPRNPLQKDQ